MNVCIGGTFDILHRGHKQLITTACTIARKHGTVFIGITRGNFVKKKQVVHSFEQRKKAIESYLVQQKECPRVLIESLEDKYGPSVNGDYDVIVVSPQTKVVAEEINRKRSKKGKKPLEIITIPFVLAEDGRPISSTRIRRKEIDENGVVL